MSEWCFPHTSRLNSAWKHESAPEPSSHTLVHRHGAEPQVTTDNCLWQPNRPRSTERRRPRRPGDPTTPRDELSFEQRTMKMLSEENGQLGSVTTSRCWRTRRGSLAVNLARRKLAMESHICRSFCAPAVWALVSASAALLSPTNVRVGLDCLTLFVWLSSALSTVGCIILSGVLCDCFVAIILSGLLVLVLQTMPSAERRTMRRIHTSTEDEFPRRISDFG